MDYTHDHLIIVIRNLYPSAVHGRDFLVAHKLKEDRTQDGEPFIVQWNMPDPEPTAEALRAEFAANACTYLSNHVRHMRDSRLKNSDSKAVAPPDAPDSVKAQAAAWETYRQALRDLPEQAGFPFTVQWPAVPA